MPDAFVDVIQKNFREQFHAADGERPFQLARDDERDDERVNTAGDAPRDSFDQTSVMFFSHIKK